MISVRGKAVDLINRMTEEKVAYIFSVLQNAAGVVETRSVPTESAVSDYEIFQESVRLLRAGNDEVLPDEIPCVRFSERIER